MEAHVSRFDHQIRYRRRVDGDGCFGLIVLFIRLGNEVAAVGHHTDLALSGLASAVENRFGNGAATRGNLGNQLAGAYRNRFVIRRVQEMNVYILNIFAPLIADNRTHLDFVAGVRVQRSETDIGGMYSQIRYNPSCNQYRLAGCVVRLIDFSDDRQAVNAGLDAAFTNQPGGLVCHAGNCAVAGSDRRHFLHLSNRTQTPVGYVSELNMHVFGLGRAVVQNS